MTNIQKLNQSKLRTSEVVRTFNEPCFNFLSLDHKGQFNFNANAKYSSSFSSGQISEALSINDLNSETEINFILEKIKDFAASKDFSFKSDFFIISPAYFSISSNKYSGADNEKFGKKISSLVFPSSDINAEMTILASITNSIQDLDRDSLYLLCIDAFTFLPISKASSLVSLDFLTIEFRSASWEIFSRIASLATSDQLTNLTLSISSFKSDETDNVIAGIFSFDILNLFNILNAHKLFKSLGIEK